ncbi:beta-eliminating lyase-related protein [Paenibacillus sp. Marseille-Q4541]|uniref:threonine aldolase family protein n=1 Tax=Paenibacillus sp. Marseille-Q4541 TaxID=2831522 RepID=UPI001BA706EE|nr:beta-eliminating lyase-related protein [Paenibacillus sp. Marseille-Q4541]
MNTKHLSLPEAYAETTYPLGGHSGRSVQMLTDALKQIDASIQSDKYGGGPIIEDFERKMADYLGKESAVFFPSGTMAQQIALRIWCDEKQIKRVAYHPLCHLEIHEEDGLKELHHIESILLADELRIITLEDVHNMPDDIACLLLELPQREIGGVLPTYEELEAISSYCRSKGIKLHLDGARLFEVMPYYQKTAAEICSLFDSVYVSFYKGIGGIAGAILAGETEFTIQSKVWKRRHGGDLISLYPYIISSDYYFDMRIGKMESYYKAAVELAGLYQTCKGVTTKPEIPVSNMFHLHFLQPMEKVEPLLMEVYEQSGVGLVPYLKVVNEEECSCEMTMGDRYLETPSDKVQLAIQLLHEKMKVLFEGQK